MNTSLRRVVCSHLLASLLLLPATGDAGRPQNKHLVGAGIAMAAPMYLAGVAQHELTHVAIAKLYGREILSVRVLPSVQNGRFYFGYMRYRPRLPTGKRTLLLLAPKLLNIALLGGYAALVHSDALPTNRYGRLAFAMWATVQWADLSKDLLLFWRNHDITRAFQINGKHSFWSRLPWRIAHVALSVAGGMVLQTGYRGVFEDDTASTELIFPLSGAF